MKYEPVASFQGNSRSKWGLGLEFAAFCPSGAMEGKDDSVSRACSGALNGLFPWLERQVLVLYAPKTPYPLLQCQNWCRNKIMKFSRARSYDLH